MTNRLTQAEAMILYAKGKIIKIFLLDTELFLFKFEDNKHFRKEEDSSWEERDCILFDNNCSYELYEEPTEGETNNG